MDNIIGSMGAGQGMTFTFTTIGLSPVGNIPDSNRGEWVPVYRDWTAIRPFPNDWNIFENTDGENSCQ